MAQSDDDAQTVSGSTIRADGVVARRHVPTVWRLDGDALTR
jgi:hypothetical protein